MKKEEEKEIIDILNRRPLILTNKDYEQVKRYYRSLLILYSKQKLDVNEVVADLLDILTAADSGDRATVFNITQYPESLEQRFD
ncbi:hypothetical protein [Pantoea agglomerans]|uniref:hypothetical protein n=1 Tax=Enterobacter agglomerans TaxID=549 RepID=UPI003C7D3FEF